MRMTISEAIAEIESEYLTFLKGTGLDDPKYMEEQRKQNLDCDRVCSANEMAINIMHKYQEIRKIYMTHHYTDEEVIEKIKEVIKWG